MLRTGIACTNQLSAHKPKKTQQKVPHPLTVLRSQSVSSYPNEAESNEGLLYGLYGSYGSSYGSSSPSPFTSIVVASGSMTAYNCRAVLMFIAPSAKNGCE